MKSKLFLVGATLLASSVAWMGCSSSSNTVNGATDGGPSATEGGLTEAGSTEAGASDSGVDSSTTVEITGPFIDIQYKGCTPLAPCGGDVTGLWRLTGGCVDDGVFAAAKGQCPGLVESNVKFQARGVVSADAVKLVRKTEVKFTATLAVPKVCKDAIGTCSDVSNAVKFTGIKNASCTDVVVDGSCTCDVGDGTTEDTDDTYTTAGTTLTSGARTFDYCVAGSEIKYKETTAKAVPAVFTLTK